MAAKGYIEISVQDWTELKEQIAKLEADMEQLMCNHLKHCMDELHWIKKKMSHYRPPWSVVTIITILTALCAALVALRF